MNELKPNNIYLGDCYKLIKQIPDKSIDLVYIDIPYLIEFSGGSKKGSPVNKRITNLMKNELKSIINGIDYSLFDELVRVMKYTYIYMVQQRSSKRYHEYIYREIQVQF